MINLSKFMILMHIISIGACIYLTIVLTDIILLIIAGVMMILNVLMIVWNYKNIKNLKEKYETLDSNNTDDSNH